MLNTFQIGADSGRTDDIFPTEPGFARSAGVGAPGRGW
jgi:hypothetical protein